MNSNLFFSFLRSASPSLLHFVLGVLFLFIFSNPLHAKKPLFGESLCGDSRYECVTIEKGDAWAKHWPDEVQRTQVMRLNRMNIRLRAGMVIAVPKDFASLTEADISLLPEQINPSGEKVVIVDLARMAWGAYDAEGHMQHWGPTSGGKDYCPDVKENCRTPAGEYYMYRKGGAACKSGKFPIPTGGAAIPYCMFFHNGFALHGSNNIPGYHASHGCGRIFTQDAEWLNKNFIEIPDKDILQGTKVIVYPYGDS